MEFRTKDELKRARWAEKYTSVGDGEQYTVDENGSAESSPFPIHEYFRNKLLGKKIKMLEVNAGYALVENMIADTMTEMEISIGENDEAEAEVWEWLDSIDYETKLEEATRDYFRCGYDVIQPIRTVSGSENEFTVANVDPATWYPTLPTFTYQPVSEARIISVFCEEPPTGKVWYAFVERHTVGNVGYELYQLESPDSLDGKKVSLNTLSQFKGLQDTPTDLPFLAVFQQNRQKSSRHLFGKSVLAPIWDILQEVSEIQTQIRQERIKHFKAKFYADRNSLARAENTNPEVVSNQHNSKQVQQAIGGQYDMSQEVFPVPTGGVIPGYIQRDLQTIEKGSAEINNLLSRAAAIAGVPRDVFNLDEKGDIHVETDRRKDRRYVRQIIQAQKRRGIQTKNLIRAYWLWAHGKEPEPVNVTFASPFALSQKETVEIMREMNATADFVSQKEAVKQVWPEKTPEEIDELLKEIDDEKAMEPQPNSVFNKPQPVTL